MGVKMEVQFSGLLRLRGIGHRPQQGFLMIALWVKKWVLGGYGLPDESDDGVAFHTIGASGSMFVGGGTVGRTPKYDYFVACCRIDGVDGILKQLVDDGGNGLGHKGGGRFYRRDPQGPSSSCIRSLEG